MCGKDACNILISEINEEEKDTVTIATMGAYCPFHEDGAPDQTLYAVNIRTGTVDVNCDHRGCVDFGRKNLLAADVAEEDFASMVHVFVGRADQDEHKRIGEKLMVKHSWSLPRGHGCLGRGAPGA